MFLTGRFLRDNAISNNVVLTGDVHSAWACEIVEDPHNPALYDPVTGRGSVGVELVCTSVSSHNLRERDPDRAPASNLAIVASNPNVAYCDLAAHGDTLVDVTPETDAGGMVRDGHRPGTVDEQTGGGGGSGRGRHEPRHVGGPGNLLLRCLCRLRDRRRARSPLGHWWPAGCRRRIT